MMMAWLLMMLVLQSGAEAPPGAQDSRDEHTVAEMLLTFREGDAFSKSEAAKWLGKQQVKLPDSLLDTMLRDPDENNRMACGYYILALQDEEIVSRVYPLAADPASQVRYMITRSLNGKGLGPAAAESILERLPDIVDPVTLARSLEALADFTLPPSKSNRGSNSKYGRLVVGSRGESFGMQLDWPLENLSPVVPMLKHEDPGVRLAAARVLGPRQSGCKNALLTVLNDGSGDQKLGAASLLGKSSRLRVNIRTVQLLIDDEDLRLRKKGLQLARKLAPAETRKIYREILDQGDDEDMMASVCVELIDIGEPQDVGRLLRLTTAPSGEHLRALAVVGVTVLEERLGTFTSRDRVLEILQTFEEPESVRVAAVHAVKMLGDSSFLDVLVKQYGLCPEEAGFTFCEELEATISVSLGRQVHGASFGRHGVRP
jgi:hypothetical protein